MNTRARTMSPSSTRISPSFSAADEPPRQGEPEPARDEAAEHRGEQVDDAEPDRSLLEELDRLVVEARVGREPAHDARAEHEARRRRDELGVRAHVHDHGEQERSDDVHRERAIRKPWADRLARPQRHAVARSGAVRAAEADQEEPSHRLGPRVGHGRTLVKQGARGLDAEKVKLDNRTPSAYSLPMSTLPEPEQAKPEPTVPAFDPVPLLAEELNLPRAGVAATVRLLAESATVPFIARYRKEATGGLDEVQIRTIEERRAYLIELDDRRRTVVAEIHKQGKLTDALFKRIVGCTTKAE